MKQIFEREDLITLIESRGSKVTSLQIKKSGIIVTQLIDADTMKAILVKAGIKVNSIELRAEGMVVDLTV